MAGSTQLANGGTNSDGLAGLQSKKSIERLEQISSLRARGISKNIDLPQLVVCGDQSSGKSSVLEGLSNIPFPRADGVCTKFPTEVLLEHAEQDRQITATIIPHSSRPTSLKAKLQAFHANISDYDELPAVIAKAGELMGLRGYGDNKGGPAFAEDVLTIKIVGRTNLHLSIVDLPGLISVASEEQTSEDVDTVHQMVDSYICKPRTIILAIVQASNDIANQSIIRKSKEVDKAGQRTVGVITKPDLINEGVESRIAALAKNKDTTRLKLGFFLLKNPSPTEMQQDITGKQRSSKEQSFFRSPQWAKEGLNADRLGIDNLRVYLQRLLEGHIEQELPKVGKEIEDMIESTRNQLARLPKERPTVAHLRTFLSDIAMQYHGLATAALNGEYHSTHAGFFVADGDDVPTTRLRAYLHQSNGVFADVMRDSGQALKITKKPIIDAAKAPTASEAPADGKSPDSEASRKPSRSSSNSPKLVSRAEMLAWIKRTLEKTRGPELPGNYNHALLTELFHHQSNRWPQIAHKRVSVVYTRIADFVKKALVHLNLEDRVKDKILALMSVKLRENKVTADTELEKLCADERRQPMTYNHYYTDNIQKARTDSVADILHRAIDRTLAASMPKEKEQLKAILGSHVIVNMNERACSEALDDLDAYYKVASKTFVDNVCRQVLERHLVCSLPNLFSPHEVASFSDEVLEQIAGETAETIKLRKELEEQLSDLEAGLDDLMI